MVSIFVAVALRDGHISVKGSLDRARSFVHLKDLISAILLLSDRKSSSSLDRCMAFNVATDVETSVRILVELILHIPRPFFRIRAKLHPWTNLLHRLIFR